MDINGRTVKSIAEDGRHLIITDEKGNVTRKEYDEWNNLTRVTYPDGAVESYEYEHAFNRLLRKTDAAGVVTDYEYDAAGRLTSSTDPLGNVTRMVYDAAGNLVSYDDGSTSALYTYDEANRKIAETLDYGPFGKTVSRTYYQNGRLRTFSGPDGITYGYLYDDGGRLSGVQIPDQGMITWNEYHWSRPATVTLPGGGTAGSSSTIRIRKAESGGETHYLCDCKWSSIDGRLQSALGCTPNSW